MKTRLHRPTPTWARIAIGVLASAVAAYGLLSIITQHHVGRTRAGKIIESTGATAVGMGAFFLGGALLMASLVVPQRFRLPTIAIGTLVMVGGILGALWGR